MIAKRTAMATAALRLDLINQVRRARESDDQAYKDLVKFRVDYIYPQMVQRYGVHAVKGAMLIFKNPRHIEECINAVLHQQRVSPMCDAWDKQGIRYTTDLLEI